LTISKPLAAPPNAPTITTKKDIYHIKINNITPKMIEMNFERHLNSGASVFKKKPFIFLYTMNIKKTYLILG